MERPAAGVVLVHGAWTGEWVWWPVRRHLRRAGVRYAAVRLPSQLHLSARLADDVAAVRHGIDRVGGPALVVGYSYGGVPATQAAADDDRVARLLFISGAMVDVGESTLDLMQGDPDPSAWNRLLCRTRFGRLLIDRARVRSIVRLRPGRRVETFVLAATPTRAGWRRVPSTYVVLTRDLVFSAALQRRLARRASRRIDLRGRHAAVFFQPRRVARIIASEVDRVARDGAAVDRG